MESDVFELATRYVPSDELLPVLLETSPEALGELLRSWFFVPTEQDKKDGWWYGCYTTFNVRDKAIAWSEQLKELWISEKFDEFAGEDILPLLNAYTCRFAGDYLINCIWFWDGDGDLTFQIGRGSELLREINNSDCKKSYNWTDV